MTPKIFTLKKLLLIVPLAILAVILIAFLIWRTTPSYNLAMLEWYGRHMKQWSSQQYYGNRLIQAGPRALPVIYDELKQSIGFRYNPNPYEILEQIPEGRAFLLDKLSSAALSQSERLHVIYALLVVYRQWDLLPEICALYVDPSIPELKRYAIGEPMNNLILTSFPGAPPFCTVNKDIRPDFLQWVSRREYDTPGRR